MSAELLVAAGPGEVRALLVEDGRPSELRVERAGAGARGDLSLGRVVALAPALPGAFLDIGAASPALLRADDGDAPPREGEALVVQVIREARAGKGPAVTTRIALAGRHLSYTPTRAGLRFADGLDGAGQAELAALLQPLLAAGEGVRVGPGAPGQGAAALRAELDALRDRWAAIRRRAAAVAPPALLEPGTPRLGRVLRDHAAGAAAIVADRPSTYAAARLWAAQDAPALLPRLRPAPPDRDIAGEIAAALEEALAPDVPLAGGGRLRIAASAAATFIDVDAGGAAALAVNLAASGEIARQIRLRNLAGGIVIDFVGMADRADRAHVLAALAAAVSGDRERCEILGWTRLGHAELRRRRGRAPLADLLLEPAAGPGRSPLTVALEALAGVARAAERGAPGRPALRVAPDVAAALQGPGAAARHELEERLGRPLAVEADAALPREAIDLRFA